MVRVSFVRGRTALTVASLAALGLVVGCRANAPTSPSATITASATVSVSASATAAASATAVTSPIATRSATGTGTTTATASAAATGAATQTTQSPTQGPPTVPPSPAPLTVVASPISNFAFAPVSGLAPVVVRWTNNDSVEHDVAIVDSTTSPPFGMGASYERRFDRAGTYSYLCSIHPFMTGTVIVR